MASEFQTGAAAAVSVIDPGTFVDSLPRDPAALFVLALALGAIAVVMIAHISHTDHKD